MMRVLVIDDSQDDRLTVRRYIRKAWPEAVVVEAASAEAGMEELVEHEFDVVLVDHHLPGQDGLWFIGAMRERVAEGPAVVMLTGSSHDDNAAEAITLGAEDYLLKDQIRPDGLRVALRNAVLKRELTVANERLTHRLGALQRFTGALVEAQGLSAIDHALSELGPEVLSMESHGLWLLDDSDLRCVGDPSARPDEVVEQALADGEPVEAGDRLALPLGAGYSRGVLDLRGTREDEAERVPIAFAMAQTLTQAVMRAHHLAIEKRLLGIASHDLRAPLFTVTMSAAILRDSQDIGEAQRGIIDRIERAAFTASRMVGDLLDFTRIELSGAIPIDAALVDVRAIVDEAVEGARARAPGRIIEASGEGEVIAEVDRDRILQAVTNLLENALKFAAEGSPITVGVDLEDSLLAISVHNHGPVIKAESMHHLFEAMVQEESEKKRDGLGLGLYIVRRIAEAHGGSTRVESGAERGTTFFIELPHRLNGGGAAPTPENA